jgi:hypothetical protein
LIHHQDAKKTNPAHPPGLPTDHTDEHRSSRPEKPQITQINADPPTRPLTQRRRGGLTGFLRVARFRPSDGREPLGRDTAPNTSFHLGVPAQRLALRKRKPRHFSFLFSSDGVHASPTSSAGEERQNRRASGTSAGEKPDHEENSLSEAAGFSPATGDHQIVCRSAANQRDRLSDPASASLRSLRSLRFLGVGGRICVICVICGETGLGGLYVSAALRLRVFLGVLPWCLGVLVVFPGRVGGSV